MKPMRCPHCHTTLCHTDGATLTFGAAECRRPVTLWCIACHTPLFWRPRARAIDAEPTPVYTAGGACYTDGVEV